MNCFFKERLFTISPLITIQFPKNATFMLVIHTVKGSDYLLNSAIEWSMP
jgi:hypothetical protein